MVVEVMVVKQASVVPVVARTDVVMMKKSSVYRNKIFFKLL